MGCLIRAETHRGKFGASINRIVGVRQGSFMLEAVGRRGLKSSIGWEFEACEEDLFQVCSVNNLGEKKYSYVMVKASESGELREFEIGSAKALGYASALNEGKTHAQAFQSVFVFSVVGNPPEGDDASEPPPANPVLAKTLHDPRDSMSVFATVARDGENIKVTRYSVIEARGKMASKYPPGHQITCDADFAQAVISGSVRIAGVIFDWIPI